MPRLDVGMKAPEFFAKTFDGKSVTSDEYQGHLVWLIFYRYPGCPMCNLHISALRARENWLAENHVNIIAVFDSPAEKFPKAVGGTGYPSFPMIADPQKKLYQLFGAESSMAGIFKPQVGVSFLKAIFSGQKQGKITGDIAQLPAHFLIAEDGVIERIYYGKSIADHISWKTVELFAQERNLGKWSPRGVIV